MTRSRYDTKQPIGNKDVAALFGYLIICNNQIHSFQQTAIKEFFERKELDYEEVRKVMGRKEDRISFESALQAFKNELPDVRTEIYFYLYVISCIDGFSDKKEKEFFSKLKESLFENISLVESTAVKKAQTERKRLKKENAVNRTGRRSRKNSEDNNNLFRISQKEYISALGKCRSIAKEDFERIKPVCESVITKGGVFSQTVNKELSSEKYFKEESKQCLSALAAEIRHVVEDSEIYMSEIDRKESAIEDFTVVFLGRTKAGKSTLRAVLTGEGRDNIGVGSQRTTRVNDIYEWNHLRIIDTPGIAAGNDLNREDRQIAEKAIGEADVICNVCSSDGVDEEVRSFIIDIAKRNKPVIVLINYKNNLEDPDEFEDFTDCPDEWRDENNKNGAMGYAKKIQRDTQENGVETLVTYQPVFLLAALMSGEEKYSEHSKFLREHSGIDEFLANLKIVVFEQGTFLRSKTIIDDMISICCDWRNRIAEPVTAVEKIHDSLKSEQNNLQKKLEKERKIFVENCVKSADKIYSTLATTHAREFADENFNAKGDISARFSAFCKEKQVEASLKNEIQKNINIFQDNAQKIIDDIIDDVRFDFKYENNIAAELKESFEIPFREITRFLGPLLNIVSSVLSFFGVIGKVAATVLKAIGAFFGISSGFFSKKADREKKKKDDLYRKLNEAVNKQKYTKIEEMQDELEKTSKQVTEKVNAKYKGLIDGIKYVADRGNALIADMDSDINELNLLFAERITEYIGDGADCRIEAVEREFGKKMKIIISGDCSADIGKLKGLINETVEVERIG